MPDPENTYFYSSTACGKTVSKRIYCTVSKSSHSNYAELKEAGEYIPPLPYSFDRTFAWDVPTYGRLDSRYYTLGMNSCFGGWSLVGSPTYTRDLRSKLLSEVTLDAVNVAMAFAEREDTFRMIRDRALTLVKAAREVRRGKFSRAANTLGFKLSQRQKKRLAKSRLDQFSENWLEYRYGWTPLMFDIHGAAAVISNHYNLGKGMFSFRTSEKFSGAVGLNPSTSMIQEPLCEYNDLIGRHGLGVDYYITDPDFLLDDALGLENPYLVGWELVPFSFVVDWFIPIGDSLRNLTAFKGLSFKGGYEYWLTQRRVKVTSYRYVNGSYDYYNLCDWGTHHDTFSRVVLNSFDDLKVNPWQTSNGVNAIRALDAVTLLQRTLLNR